MGAFGGLEEIDQPPDEVPQATDRSIRGLSQHGLELGEGLLDRIEVATVGQHAG